MGSTAGGLSCQGISVKDLLKEVLQCETVPSDHKAHGGGGGRSFVVEGRLFGEAIISPYESLVRADRELRWQDPIGQFGVTGVIEDQGYLLAFCYRPTVNLPTPDRGTQKKFRENGGLKMLVDGMIEAAETEYIHLRAALTQGQPHISLCGQVKNNSPRLFLAQGMAVETERDARRTRHGFFGDMQNRPIYR